MKITLLSRDGFTLRVLRMFIRRPVAYRTHSAGLVLKLLDNIRIGRQFHPIDHLQCDVVTRDHVDLSRYVG